MNKKIRTVDHSSKHADVPRFIRGIQKILNYKQHECSIQDRTGSRGQAAGSRSIHCQQTLVSCLSLLVCANLHAATSQAPIATTTIKAPVTAPPPPPHKSAVNAIAPNPIAVPQQPLQPLDCTYHISPDTPKVDSSIVMQWAENAALRAFDFNDSNIDTRLGALKPCFTEQGWQSFNQALLQSGNIDAIKSQQLNVSAQRNGKIIVDNSKENQWKVTIPLQVVYQNTQQRLTQQLIVNLLIGRQTSGDLGILQMIAAPQQPTPVTIPPPEIQNGAAE
jgi:hypothetical protein